MKRLLHLPNIVNGLSMLMAGALHALTFAPDPLPENALALLQVLLLAFLAHRQLTASSWRHAWWQGWLFNTACYAVGLYWIFISLHVYGALAWPLAVAAVLIFSFLLALFPTAGGVLAYWLTPLTGSSTMPQRLWASLAFATCWTTFEWIRGTLWTGFPWLNIGYAHLHSPLVGWAAILGVYGIGWFAAASAAVLGTLKLRVHSPQVAHALTPSPYTRYSHYARHSRYSHHSHASAHLSIPSTRGAHFLRTPFSTRLLRAVRALPSVIPFLLVIALIILSDGLACIHWAYPVGAPLHVRLIQGNIAQSQKFDPAHIEKSIQQHLEQAAMPPPPHVPPPQLIVLPETVLPVFQDNIKQPIWESWRRITQTQHATLIMGIPLHQNIAGQDRYTNSAIGIDAQTSPRALYSAQLAMRYDKHHLVPFGEFIPPGFHWFIRWLNIPLGYFDRGALSQPSFKVADQRLALNICYENLFGEELLPALRADSHTKQAGASILLNLSNLGWFGHTWALRQHLQISRMRTLETARPLLAATNTGITAAINARGQVIAEAPVMQAVILHTTVQGMAGLTPYVRLGNTPIIILMLGVLLGFFYLRIKNVTCIP